MKLLKKLFLGHLGFQHQIAMIFSLGIACVTVVTSLVVSSISNETVYKQLLQQGRQITNAFARQSALALLYKSPDNAQEAAKTPLSFPDTVGVAIYTADHQLLYHKGVSGVLEQSTSWPSDKVQHRETPDAWHFSAPVYSGSGIDDEESPFTDTLPARELIGYTQVVISKATLSAMSHQILVTNLLVPGGLISVLLLLLFAITNRVSRPLKSLADVMRRAEQGETQVRALLNGPRDIILMESAFNTMMHELESREQELKRARDTALASAHAKGEFAASISHELRTPMNGVMGMLELLQDMGLNVKQEEYLRIARSSGASLLSLIDEILDFSKLESAKMKLNAEAFCTRTIVEDVVSLLDTQAKAKQLTLGAELEEKIPALVCGDGGRVRQVLINLVGNAIKFTSSGKVTIAVSLCDDDRQDESETEQIKLRFSVQDTGIGIPLESQQRIFEAFAQADSSTTRRYGGTGLGLAICRQLVGLLGGHMGLESYPEKGSTFWFTVPLERALCSLPDPKEGHCDFAGLRILVVGSNSEHNRSLCQAFKDRESFLRCASHGQGALGMLHDAIAQGKPYDLVITDEDLADISGTALAKEIIHQAPDGGSTRVLVISEAGSKQEPIAHSFINCVYRPIEPPQLRSASASLLRRRAEVLPESPSAQENNLPQNAEDIRILVAEDNLSNQQVAIAMLERMGYATVVANNGQEALEKLAQNNISIVLMDCHMPVLDGYDTTQQIRASEEHDHQTPIVAMTADVGPDAREQCLKVGMNDYIPKPLQLESLKKVIQRWLPVPSFKEQVQSDNASALSTQSGISSIQPESIANVSELEGDAKATAMPGNQKSGDQEVFNLETFEKLRRDTGKAFPKLIKAFLKDSPKYIEGLTESISTNDQELMFDAAHGIKGSAMSLGAEQLANYCRQMEVIARSTELTESKGLLNKIQQSYQQLTSILEQSIKGSSTNAGDTSENELSDSETLQNEKPTSIMIVDDERSARLVLRGALEQNGYHIEEFENGATALEACTRHMPDLILMDVMMPKMDGFTSTEKIRQIITNNPPSILMLTALQDEDSIEKAFKVGATDYITKPINLAVLRKRVNGLMKAIQAEKHIHSLAYNDQLTGLPNRALFIERSSEVIRQAKLENQLFSLLFIDLDRFKLINDTQGHDIGDTLLKVVAKRITGCVRSADLVVRLGGDEFIVLLNGLKSSETAARVADKICQTLSQPFTFLKKTIRAPTSIGISMYPKDGTDIRTLMKHADMAMFRAKGTGGNHYEFYEYGMETEIARRVEIEHELRQAIVNNELVLHYQPQLNLSTGELVGAEALVRWEHPQRGLLPPADFINVAEESGLINSLGEWVLRESCSQLQRWLTSGVKLNYLAVNISSHQIKDATLAMTVEKILIETQLPPSKLELELTESVIAEGSEENISVLQNLKSLGVSLAIDDFGTGYSSLSYLTRFPVDKIKLDRSFVQKIPENKDSASIVVGITALCHSLRLSVVAEGVETEEQKNFLIEKHCDVMQGYLLSRPLPADEFEKWLLTQPLT